MKELQKYYHDFRFAAGDNPGPYYLASEADAAFAEMRREHAEELTDLVEEAALLRDDLKMLKKHQAEEIERLQKSLDTLHGRPFSERVYAALHDRAQRNEKQAERYEKLRRLYPRQFLELWKTNLMGARFDDLVDQLSDSSGEQGKT